MDAVSLTDRNSLWSDMEAGSACDWDIIIVGGGITGAGVLREAVRLGYKSLLLEQRDFAWGSSSRSSKMVHGGLRYLAAGKISLTRHSLKERERLLHEAPGLVERMSYYYPLYHKVFPPRFAARILFWLYDRIAGISDHRLVSNQQLKMKFRDLVTGPMRGAFYYTDAITDDARLTLRVLHESVRAGGFVRNYTRAEQLLKDNGRVHGLVVKDKHSGQSLRLEAKVVINATGAWADRLRSQTVVEQLIRPQRGSHIVLSAEDYPVRDAIFLLHPDDGRRLFIYPWERRTVVGTTDIYHPRDLDTAASITAPEMDYLLSAAKQLFPNHAPGYEDVISSWSGVRPIVVSGGISGRVPNRGSGNPSKEGRDHQVWVDNGLLTCSGGKLTTFRYMARDVMGKARPFLPAAASIDDERVFTQASLSASALSPGDPAWGRRMLGRYGDSAALLLADTSDAQRKTLHGTDFCLAEVRWALQHESVVHLDDLMLRRTRLGLLLRDGGAEVLEAIGQLCHEVLAWDESRWHSEKSRYMNIIKRHYTVPDPAQTTHSR